MVEPIPRIVVVNPTDDLFESCKNALDELCTVRAVEIDFSEPDQSHLAADVMLLPLFPPHFASVAFYATCRREYPTTPLILLAEDIDAGLAVELLQLGADDLLPLPVTADALAKKVRRMLGQPVGPALDRPELVPLKVSLPEFHENRRQCFRAKVPLWRQIAARVAIPGGDCVCSVVDLSIPTNDAFGGMLLCTSRAAAQLMPFENWERGEKLKIRLDMPDRPAPIEVEGMFVAGLRLGKDRNVHFAIQYLPKSPPDDARLRRVWAEMQRPQAPNLWKKG